MKHSSMLFPALLLALAGCTTTSAPPAGVSQNEPGETAGKAAEAAPPPPPSCKSIARIGSKTAPPEIYEDMQKCIQEENFENGVALFALAGTYSFYDALRVEDPSTYVVTKELPHDSFKALDASRKTAFMEAVRGALGNDAKLAAICKDVIHAGPPNYYPAYMILEGENGSATVKAKGGLSTSFDSKTAWNKALNRFLHCSS